MTRKYTRNALSSLEASVSWDRTRPVTYEMTYQPAIPPEPVARRTKEPFMVERRAEVVLLLLFGFWCTTAVSLAILVMSLIIQVTM